MNTSHPALRLSISLTLVSAGVVLLADLLGLIPRRSEMQLASRRQACESLATQLADFIDRGEHDRVRGALKSATQGNRELLAATVRDPFGKVIAEVRNPPNDGRPSADRDLAAVQIQSRIVKNQQPLGAVELRFQPPLRQGLAGILDNSLFKLTFFVMLAGFVAYLTFMRTILRHVSPASMVPARVKSALDSLTEGVVFLDERGGIVLANAAFADCLGQAAEALVGRPMSGFGWVKRDSADKPAELPWNRAMRDGRSQMGIPLGLRGSENHLYKFMVNATPIMAKTGGGRGVLVTLDDVTQLEAKNEQLRDMLSLLETSREQIHRRNEELQLLATRDPLTGCLNRRSLIEKFEVEFNAARRHGHSLSCVIVDLDHFKHVNDRHGHAVGDQVLQRVAQVLKATLRASDSICRYGGEEFCILLPQVEADKALKVAERFRRLVEAEDFGGIRMTASFGLSSTEFAAASSQELFDQSDKALYQAKSSGRNRVVAWPDVKGAGPEGGTANQPEPADLPADAAVPLHAVNALVFALARRDAATADHCRQVADLSMLVAVGSMSPSECFLLEVAALLHDIGKLSAPDAILYKAGPLTEQEWSLMRSHGLRGVEIVSAIFRLPRLTEIVRHREAWFGANPRLPGCLTGRDIPLASRVLSIADAFSAMTNDRPYRAARGHEEAFAELRRAAGEQFDPELVERFIEAVSAADASRKGDKSAVSTGLKLAIGWEAELLATALKASDWSALSAIARRLAATAARQGLTRVTTIAEQIEKLAVEHQDVVGCVKLVAELTDFCGAAHEPG